MKIDTQLEEPMFLTCKDTICQVLWLWINWLRWKNQNKFTPQNNFPKKLDFSETDKRVTGFVKYLVQETPFSEIGCII